MCSKLTSFCKFHSLFQLIRAILKWNYDFKMRNPLPVQDPFSVIGFSIKNHAIFLYSTTIKPNTALWAVRKQSVWQILKKFLSYMMLACLEYRFLWALSTLRTIHIKGFFTYFSLYFLRDSTLDLIFPLVSPLWLLSLTLISWLLTDWLLSNNIFPVSKGGLPGTVYIGLEWLIGLVSGG